MIPARDQPVLLCVCWFARPLNPKQFYQKKNLNRMTSATSLYLPAGRSIVWTSGDGRCQLFCLACRPSIPWARTLLASSSSSINQPKLLSIIVASCVRVLDELHMNLAGGVKASKILRG